MSITTIAPGTMEEWRRVFRAGFLPSLSTTTLTALEEALRSDDHKLTQGSTTTPPPLMCVQDWPCEAGDLLGFAGVIENGGWGKATVGECEEFFARACFEADERLGEPAACRWFLNFWDDAPRKEAFSLVLSEVIIELDIRADLQGKPCE